NHLVFTLTAVVIEMAPANFKRHVLCTGNPLCVDTVGLPDFGETADRDKLLQTVTIHPSHATPSVIALRLSNRAMVILPTAMSRTSPRAPVWSIFPDRPDRDSTSATRLVGYT